MGLLTTLTLDACRSLIGVEVADRSGQPVGTLGSRWAEAGPGRLPSLGVRAPPGQRVGACSCLPRAVEVDPGPPWSTRCPPTLAALALTPERKGNTHIYLP